MRSVLLLLIVVFTSSFFQFASAVPEGEYGIIYDLLKNGEGSFYKEGTFHGANNVRIHFTKFGFSKGQKGSVVLLPGRTEDSLKYLETAYDLIQKGFSPVYVLDHRGQGFSGRLLSDPQKGHVEDYKDYLNDFSRFVTIVLRDPKVNSRNLHLISHSMGGVVAISYLKANPHTFKSYVSIAPMHQILLDKPEPAVLRDTWLACYVQFRCNEYIPDGGPFRWQDRKFEDNTLTHSFVRFSYRDHLWKNWPELQLGDPTIRWVRASIQASFNQRNYTYLKTIKTPILMFQATDDKVVANQGQRDVCGYMRGNCTLLRVRGARHEILMETDRLRDAVMKRVVEFLAAH